MKGCDACLCILLLKRPVHFMLFIFKVLNNEHLYVSHAQVSVIGDGSWMLVQALLGLHINENGSDDHVLAVLLDNINVKSVDEEPLRASVSLVPKVRTQPHHPFV